MKVCTVSTKMKETSAELPRVALVTRSPINGGLGTMTRFLHRVLSESGRYCPEIISLATSYSDEASVLLHLPQSWLCGPQVQIRQQGDLQHRHVGAYWPELEFQRNRPRAILDRVLNEYDLIQFIVGAPYWACAAIHISKPVVLWTATTVRADRASRVQYAPLLRKIWQRVMIPIQQAAERQALRQVEHVFALSEYTANTIKPWTPNGKVDVAVCGVDTALFRPDPQSQGEYALCVGRLSDRRKNVPLLLEAYAKAIGRSDVIPDLYLVGALPDAIGEWICALGIADRVQFLGEQYGRDLADLYRNARFFVLSSDEEGLGIVILEAMASGLPVISTDCGGPATAVVEGKTGFLVPVGDADSLATAMQRLAENPQLCRRMGEAGRTVAEERFSLTVAGNVFLDKYKELLIGQRPGRRTGLC
jgi:glycosyltransferase involved in cell wall biosynthesis